MEARSHAPPEGRTGLHATLPCQCLGASHVTGQDQRATSRVAILNSEGVPLGRWSPLRLEVRTPNRGPSASGDWFP